ncbi:MAG TPA: hypothetical protein VJ583_01440 [Nitrososphaeraceae archaeon]|nr:hypothetical protein [Nitrososphaeraceae archaeon]
MGTKKQVIMIGLKPEVADFSNWSGLTPEKLMSELKTDEATLNSLGYDAQLCLVDLGETAETVVTQKLKETAFDCVMIGAGVRTIPDKFLLFEKLINIVHKYAPAARICFNTKPSDTAEAVQRWVQP